MKEDINFKHREQRRFYHKDPETRLSGVDFVQLAEATPRHNISPLEVEIDVTKAGCWVGMLAANWEQSLQHAKEPHKHPRGLKVVAIFCHGLSQTPIRNKTTSCHVWAPAPEGHDYLITTLGCIHQLADAQEAERGKLSPQHWWQLGTRDPFDFEKCREGGYSGSCNRLQKLRNRKKKPHFENLKTVGVILDTSKEDGAIIFGEEFWLSTNRHNEPCNPVLPVDTFGPGSEQANRTNS